jgi:hypothetical protein
MSRRPSPSRRKESGALPSAELEPTAVLQIKIWLLGISPMVWRRVLKGIETGPEPAPHPFCRNRFVAPVSSHLSTRQVATGNPFCRNAAPVSSHYYQLEHSFYSAFQGLNL